MFGFAHGQIYIELAPHSLNLSILNILVPRVNNCKLLYIFNHRLFNEKCGSVVIPPCDALNDVLKTSKLLHDTIKRSQFKGADGNTFQFTKTGDGPGGYKVLNFQTKNKFMKKTGYLQVKKYVLLCPSANLTTIVKEGEKPKNQNFFI